MTKTEELDEIFKNVDFKKLWKTVDDLREESEKLKVAVDFIECNAETLKEEASGPWCDDTSASYKKLNEAIDLLSEALSM